MQRIFYIQKEKYSNKQIFNFITVKFQIKKETPF